MSDFSEALCDRLARLLMLPDSARPNPFARRPSTSLANIPPPFDPLSSTTFTLPEELQGGVSNISSRRPSFAAEMHHDVWAPWEPQPQPQPHQPAHPPARRLLVFANPPPPAMVELEDGLLFNNLFIMVLRAMKAIYTQAEPYFGSLATADQFVTLVDTLVTREPVVRLVQYLRSLNNLHMRRRSAQSLTLVANKNGRMEILCLPSLNLFLQNRDLVVVDGDRGKDLCMVLKPLVDLQWAVLFNFLKKREHLKSLETRRGNSLHAASQDDNEFMVLLPTKQVLRFATSPEVYALLGKYQLESAAFLLAQHKVAQLALPLMLVGSEYQFDYKKLIFYYFADFTRCDFRQLIKELFKVYKTRIWLCAVLPYYSAESGENGARQSEALPTGSLLQELAAMRPNDFHTRNLLWLAKELEREVEEGRLYGFGPPGVARGAFRTGGGAQTHTH